MTPGPRTLTAKIASKEALVCIIGMGHVGLPEAVLFAKSGFNVVGFDTNADKVAEINGGISDLVDVDVAELKELLEKGVFSASSEPAILDKADVAVIAVPTLLTRHKNPEVTAVHRVAESLGRHIHNPTLVILESTGPPGVTEDIVKTALENEGLRHDEDYFLACSPARIDPGNKDWPLKHIPKIVGGLTAAAGDMAEQLYLQVMDNVVRASSAKAAEMTKLMENSFRAVNIAFVDQMHMICHAMGLDIYEIIDLARTKPFGFVPFYPGPGPGGDCIPVDPFYVAWKAREFESRAHFIELAGETMDAIPHFFVRYLTDLLSDAGKPMKDAKILLVGITYKKDVSDVSNSPAHSLIHLLSEREADIGYFDPHVPEFRTNGSFLQSTPLTAERLREQDAVMIVTNHSGIDYDLIVENSKLILDSRNALANYRPATNIHR